MSKVIGISTGKPPLDNTQMLAVIDQLRNDIIAGKIVAFVAVGLDAGDTSYGWAGSVGGVTKLRMMGAIANMQQQYHNGTMDEP